MGRPKIGVTVPRAQSRAFRDYLQRIQEAGGEPIELVPGDLGPPDALDALDGLLLPGGGDVEPSRYGAEAHPESGGIRPELDEMEVGLIRRVHETGLPLLAICRGQQILNVALGGALHQHIEDDAHRAESSEGNPSRWHPVQIESGSRLATLLGAGTQSVNSRHHQAVRPELVAERLRIVAFSPDGFVEAMESRDDPWLIAVQWHPERDEIADRSRPLFEDFTRAAAGRRALR